MALSEQDRQRLASILGMLGSEHDGERASAARKAEQLRRKADATWDELLTGQIVYELPKQQRTWPRQTITECCIAYVLAALPVIAIMVLAALTH